MSLSLRGTQGRGDGVSELDLSQENKAGAYDASSTVGGIPPADHRSPSHSAGVAYKSVQSLGYSVETDIEAKKKTECEKS